MTTSTSKQEREQGRKQEPHKNREEDEGEKAEEKATSRKIKQIVPSPTSTEEDLLQASNEAAKHINQRTGNTARGLVPGTRNDTW